MGVPGFFAWLLKKYKKSNNIIINEIHTDKKRILYLDANCFIHPECFTVLNYYVNETSCERLEQQMIKRIINYLNFLILITRADEVFISVDGVAPLAKMNQQRKRRFRSVDDTRIKEEIYKKYNKKTCQIWNNTCITPGTEFMEKLHDAFLKYISTSNKPITYSSYHTPGEGEHKILQNIKTKDNNNHVYIIYGLDADLIFLALSSQKENIYLLREAAHFGKKEPNCEVTDIIKDVKKELNYVSIKRFKECINEHIGELIGVSNNISSDVSNDFIFICYLLGNDFLPHLPSIDIKTGGLDFVINSYVDIYINLNSQTAEALPLSRSPFCVTLVQFKNNQISINSIFFELLLKTLADSEEYYFKTIYPKHEMSIQNRKCPMNDPCEKELWELDNMKCFDIIDPINLGTGDREMWKYRYYSHYFGVNDYQKEYVDIMCQEYVRGLMWVSKYYFEKCPSYKWQYSYSHAPFISDIYRYFRSNKININNIKFTPDEPLDPFSQLLAVIPPACSDILPQSYKYLVTSPKSSIIDYYPIDIKLDMINKDSFYKCIPFIPAIDVSRIIDTVKKAELHLTNEEKNRNKLCDVFTNIT